MIKKYLYTILIIAGQVLFSVQLYSNSPIRQTKFKVVAPLREIKIDENLPTFVDNSLLKYFPPIINQKGGSCAQASGIGYMFTYEINRFLDTEAKDDERLFSYLYVWNYLNNGKDEGGFVDSGLQIAKRIGVMTEKDYGYSSAYQYKWASGYEKYYNASKYRVKSIFNLKTESSEDILGVKQHLFNGGLLTFSIYTQTWDMNSNYTGPSKTNYTYLLNKPGLDGGAHALTIVGYDDFVESTDKDGNLCKGAFIVVNSWGKHSHDNGRFYLPYHLFTNRPKDTQNHNFLSYEFTGIDVKTHTPAIMFKIGLNYSSRNDLYISIMGDDKEEGSYFQYVTYPFVYNNNGGDFPMCGAYGGDKYFEFGIDFSDQFEKGIEANHDFKRFALNITVSERGKISGEGQLEHFSVIDYRYNPPKEYFLNITKPLNLKLGKNIFEINTDKKNIKHISANPISWKSGKFLPLKETFIIRSENGKSYYKMVPVKYDPKTGKTKFIYKKIERE